MNIESMEHRVLVDRALERGAWDRRRLSWRSVIAGVVTTCAVSTLLAVLGVALGFTVLEPTSAHPLSGLGVAFGIWSAVTLIISFAAGGYMAGYASTWRGCEHGFLTWALVLLIGTLFTGMAVSSAARMAGSAVASVGSGVAQVAGGVAGGVGDLASGAFDKLEENVDLNFDGREFRGNVVEVLRDTEVETLQPEYLQDQLRGARSDLRNALNQLSLNSDNYDQIISNFLDKQQARLETIGADVDREAAVTALMNNRYMTRDEAEQTVDNALRVYNRAVANAKQAMTDLRQQVEDTRVYLRQAADEARVMAEEASNAIASSALIAAIALIIGAAISCGFAVLGNRRSRARYPYPV